MRAIPQLASADSTRIKLESYSDGFNRQFYKRELARMVVAYRKFSVR